MNSVRTAVLSLALLLAGGVQVQANSVNVSNFAVTPSGNSYLWSYEMSVSPGAVVKTGDYFALLDWGGYAGGATGPSGWTFSYTPTLPACPPMQSAGCAADNPAVGNLMWQYAGPNLGPNAVLGTFTALAFSGNVTVGLLLAQDHSVWTGLPSGNNQSVPVPAVSVPEPHTVVELAAYAGITLALVGLFRIFGRPQSVVRS
jgi:hypothetical protein